MIPGNDGTPSSSIAVPRPIAPLGQGGECPPPTQRDWRRDHHHPAGGGHETGPARDRPERCGALSDECEPVSARVVCLAQADTSRFVPPHTVAAGKDPKGVAKFDDRSPAEIIRNIHDQGQIVADALARLAALVGDDEAGRTNRPDKRPHSITCPDDQKFLANRAASQKEGSTRVALAEGMGLPSNLLWASGRRIVCSAVFLAIHRGPATAVCHDFGCPACGAHSDVACLSHPAPVQHELGRAAATNGAEDASCRIRNSLTGKIKSGQYCPMGMQHLAIQGAGLGRNRQGQGRHHPV